MDRNSSLTNSSLGLPSANVSSEDDEYEEMNRGSFHPVVDIPPIVLAVFIVSINCMVLVLMAKKKYLRSITNLLLCSLAVSDLLTGVVAVPLFIVCNVHTQSATCLTEELVARFISALIVCHLMAVTTDRYLAIIHPLRYSSLVTKPRCILVILFIWLLSVVTSLVQFTWFDPVHHDPHEEESDQLKKKELIYDIMFLTLYFFVPVVVMLVSYVRIILEIVRQSRNIQQQSTPSQNAGGSRNRHEWKAIAIFAAMMLVYIICWLPYFSLRRFDLTEVPPLTIYCIVWLRYLASLLNPCMYIFGKQDFRRATFEHVHLIKLELNLASTSKSTILKASSAASGGKGDKIDMYSFTRIGSKKVRNSRC